jgi:HAD superfamily hydrolase (TIGR01509 family)
MIDKPKAIFFDVGNTLLFPNRSRILAPLRERKLFPTEEQLRRLESRTKNEFDSILQQDGRADRGFWYLFYAHLLEELGVQDERLHDALVEATRISANWCDIRPGTREILLGIAKKHALGIISNADGKIAEILAHCELADCFRTITDSGIVGYEKPHLEIFQAALREMGVRAEQSLYIGDVYSVDYLGATRAGMRALLFDMAGAYREKGLPRIESLEALPAILSAS